MYQLSFKHALFFSTVAHTVIGMACYAGGWFDPIQAITTSENCDGNHIPHISASIITELPRTTLKIDSGAVLSETGSSTGQIAPSNIPPLPSNDSEVTLREKSKDTPHYHPLSVIKKIPNKQVKKSKTSSAESDKPDSLSIRTNALEGSLQALPANGTQSNRSTEASPSYFRNPLPIYPEAARRMRREGLVTLLVTVESNGLPSSITISNSSGHQALDDAAIRAVQNWKFKPGEINGAPVQSKVEIPVRFSLQ
jgi:TonB family protein